MVLGATDLGSLDVMKTTVAKLPFPVCVCELRSSALILIVPAVEFLTTVKRVGCWGKNEPWSTETTFRRLALKEIVRLMLFTWSEVEMVTISVKVSPTLATICNGGANATNVAGSAALVSWLSANTTIMIRTDSATASAEALGFCKVFTFGYFSLPERDFLVYYVLLFLSQYSYAVSPKWFARVIASKMLTTPL
jgi:hypothetical protein